MKKFVDGSLSEILKTDNYDFNQILRGLTYCVIHEKFVYGDSDFDLSFPDSMYARSVLTDLIDKLQYFEQLFD